MSKPRFQIVDLGVDHSDCFQGFGTSYTQFDQSTYGIGSTAKEAYDDALESMAMSDCSALVLGDMPDDCPFEGRVMVDAGDDVYYHVGIRWNNVKAEDQSMTTIKMTVPRFPGFYESMICTDSAEEQLVESLTDSEGEYAGRKPGDVADALYWTTNYSLAHAQIAKDSAERFANLVNEECITGDSTPLAFTFESMDSPKEYNFTTDRLYVSLPLDQFQWIYDATSPMTLAAVIRQQYTSRDGFISFYSNDLQAPEWQKPLAEFDHNQAGTVLEAFLRDNMDTDVLEEMSYRIYERGLCEDIDNALSNAIDWDALKARLNVSEQG